MGFDFTESQRAAIYTRGSSILVSAAAGSGKTRVLTERVISYVTDELEPRDIGSFLIITYTRAAAAELRGRITSLLAEKAAENPFDRRLRRQQEQCASAMIGTIHSFCAQVLRENCQALGLAPSFSVLEQGRGETMRAQALEKVLEKRYETIEEHPEFRLLSDTVGVGRDDARLVQTVLALHTKLMSHPYPEDWAERQMRALSEPGDRAEDTVWGRELMLDAQRSVAYWLRRMDEAVSDIQAAGGKTEKAYLSSFSETAAALRAFSDALGAGWDPAHEKRSIPFPRLGVVRGPEDPELIARLKAVRDGCKKAALGWAQTFSDTSEQALSDIRAMAPAMCELLRLTLETDRAYSAEKRRRDALDFSDLEHLTLSLLVDRETGAPTETARRLSQRYTEIMVDEYQDVNAVQELIFSAVSRGGRNLFTVGDVKQSIYRFRLADPTIFMEKYRRFSETPELGRLILLRENFRSRRCVLDAANRVFSLLMSEELGEMRYDESASLVFGSRAYPDGADSPVELRFLDADADEDTPGGVRAEALYIAARMKELFFSGEPVWENGVSRPCRWGDFALLLHSPGVNGEEFAKTLAGAGIPVASGGGSGFFALPETAAVVNMLEVLDDPRADVPLIALLRSPVFGFSPDELAAVRAGSRDGCFYDALLARAGDGDEKCAAFARTLAALRGIVPELTMDALLWRIYSETDCFAVFAAAGGERDGQRSLMLLIECARDFAAAGGFGLPRFVEYLRGMAARGEGPDTGADGDCVHIMSIHKSKGLEFPFVFLADLSHGFNRQDIYAPVLMHARLGLGPKLTDPERGVEYPTIARRAVAARMLREKLSEELRVLYVAMTRAKERLIMTCLWPGAQEKLDEMAPLYSDGAAPELLLGAQSFAKWLAAVAILDKSGAIDARVISPAAPDEPDTPESGEAAPAPVSEADPELTARIKAALEWRYPYAYAVDLPTKLTATGLEKSEAAEPDADAAPLIAPALPADTETEFRRPDFGEAQSPGAAARGTAMHAMLQYADLSALKSEADILRQARSLADAGHLTPEQVRSLDTAMLLRFGRSGLCSRIAAADELRREFRFTLLAGAEDYFDVPPGETLLIQGVVDCFIVEGGSITVIDYKTDRVTGPAESYAARYFPQLRAYAAALGRICRRPVKQALLHFLRTGETVSVPLS